MSNYPVVHPVRPLTKAQMQQLLTDLTGERVATRSQGRSTLSYIEAWDARRTAIRIFGFGGFSTRVVNVRTVYQEQDVPATEYQQGAKKDAPKTQKVERLFVPTLQRNPETGETRIVNVEHVKPMFNWRVAVETTVEVYIHQLGAIYTDAGVAGQVGPDIGEVADFATKTATSDTFKRCMINMGTQFGLSLYNEGGLNDVVNRVIAPGQRAIDVDWEQFQRANEEIERATQLRAWAEEQRAGGKPAPAADPAPADGPTEQETQAAEDTLASGFGGGQ